MSSRLIDGANEDGYRGYQEKVDCDLISVDKQNLVFMGADYHYAFDAAALFVDTITSPLHAYMPADVSKFMSM